jgi:hypothetical protein
MTRMKHFFIRVKPDRKSKQFYTSFNAMRIGLEEHVTYARHETCRRCIKFRPENPKGRDNLDELDVEKKKILGRQVCELDSLGSI